MVYQGRSPRGERGLKSSWRKLPERTQRSLPARGAWIEILIEDFDNFYDKSLPARGAWIEIIYNSFFAGQVVRRSPRGERGLKLANMNITFDDCCRSPRGERGLKSRKGKSRRSARNPSLPARGAWIEIVYVRACWLSEIPSLPARGAWIEIPIYVFIIFLPIVAPREGSVD